MIGSVNSQKLMQRWVLPNTGTFSSSTQIPGNTFRYQRTEYLITPAEMAASLYPSGQTIDGIGFEIYKAGSTSQTGNLKIYLMNTSNTAYSLGSAWTTAGFTQVCNISSWTVPIGKIVYTINFTGGSPFTYTGGGVYVAWEFSNPSPGTLGTNAVWPAMYASSASALYMNRSNLSLPATLVVSTSRPATMFFNNALTDILNLTNIYTCEKFPVPQGTPNKVSVRVQNVNPAAVTFSLSLSVNSHPPYTATLPPVTLAGSSAGIYDFTGWSPATQEDVTVTVTASPVAGETFLSNNTLSIPVQVNNSLFSHTLAPVFQGMQGASTEAMIWASKFHMSGHGTVTGANIGVSNNTNNPGIGKYVKAVLLNSAGAIVAQSADLVLTAANGNMIDTFAFVTPAEFTNEDFYVGLYQQAASTLWFPMAYMKETPQRPGTFYYFNATGGTPNAAVSGIKWIIEARVAVEPLPVPTLTEWGLVLLGLALVGAGTLFLLRRG
jgi:hypothetical protein